MAVTAHFGETIHYNAFTDVTSITDATRDDLEEKGFNITVGAYPIEVTNMISTDDSSDFTQLPINLFKIDELSQKIYLPTLNDILGYCKRTGFEFLNSMTYKVMLVFATTYINPSDETPAIDPVTVEISCEYSIE